MVGPSLWLIQSPFEYPTAKGQPHGKPLMKSKGHSHHIQTHKKSAGSEWLLKKILFHQYISFHLIKLPYFKTLSISGVIKVTISCDKTHWQDASPCLVWRQCPRGILPSPAATVNEENIQHPRERQRHSTEREWEKDRHSPLSGGLDGHTKGHGSQLHRLVM